MENQPKRLYRSRSDRIIAGICGGLGRYFNIDPVFVRIAFILLTLADGFGLLLYLILLIFVPEEPGEHVEVDRGEKIKEFASRVGQEAKSWTEGVRSNKNWLGDKRNVIGLIIIIFGLILLINQLFAWSWFKWHLFWPLIIVIIGLYLIFKSKGK